MEVIGAISPFNADVSEPKRRYVNLLVPQLGTNGEIMEDNEILTRIESSTGY